MTWRSGKHSRRTSEQRASSKQAVGVNEQSWREDEERLQLSRLEQGTERQPSRQLEKLVMLGDSSRQDELLKKGPKTSQRSN
jgi:hypothetical protein